MLEYICEGCCKADMKRFMCTVYEKPPGMFVGFRCCPFNRRVTTKKREKIRVGQQKQNK